MVTVIVLIIFFFAMGFYVTGKTSMTLTFLFMLANKMFGLIDSEGSAIKGSDLLILAVIIILIHKFFLYGWKYFNLKNDKIGKIVLLALFFFIFELIRTIVFSLDTPIFALKTIKCSLVLLAYFYIRRIKLRTILRFVKYVYMLSLIQGILFYLQLVGLTGVLHGYLSKGDDYTRYGNYPDLAIPFFLYFLFSNKIDKKVKTFNLLFWGMMPVVGMMRGSILATAISIAIYYSLHWKKKYFPYLIAAALSYVLVIGPMFAFRESLKSSSAENDLKGTMFSQDFSSVKAENGTFSFRLAMLAERGYFLYSNPQYIPIGVGAIHEESPNNKFSFLLGTVNENLVSGKCQIESGDITWVPILLRYGLVGFLICFYLFYIWFINAYRLLKKTNNPIVIVIALMSVYLFFVSWDSELFDKSASLYFLIFYLSLQAKLVHQYRLYKKHNNINSSFPDIHSR